MEMGGGDHYDLPDLRQLVAGRTHFPANPQVTEPFFVHRNLPPPPPPQLQLPTHHRHEAAAVMVGEMVLPGGLVRFGHDHLISSNGSTTTTSSTAAATAATTTTTSVGNALYGVDMVESGWIGNDAGNSRWPRQETLTLLEIRSRLDSKFKEANQKGPLWDEVSRIMGEEHGYQRSGKKCREKFENLYKYYKKTKEGKAGRQDGKHYRFFRQLEALYGETSNHHQASLLSAETHLSKPTNFLYQNPNYSAISQENQELLQEQHKMMMISEASLSTFSNTSEFETSSSENNDDHHHHHHHHDLSGIAYVMNNNDQSMENQMIKRESQDYSRAIKKSWKAKVKNFVDSQMRKLVETQEAWMEKMLKTIEDREKERMSKEEEWRKQETARLDREHEFWAKERAWVEARDAALMKAIKKFTGKGLELSSSSAAQMAKQTHTHYKNKEKFAKEFEYDHNINRWSEPEVSVLIQLRNSLEQKFQENGGYYSREGLWEEIAEKLASLGYDRSPVECKEKWDNLQLYFNMTTEISNKKNKEDLRSSNTYFHQLESYHSQEITKQGLERMNSASNSYAGNQVNDSSCFHILINEGDHLWDKYGTMKLSSKGKNQQL